MKNLLTILVTAVLAAFYSTAAQAGVQNLTHFQPVGSWSIGLEPELTLASAAGIGANFKFTYGLNDLSNVQAILGTGGPANSFRAGGAVTFDFYPDFEGQPGIGLAMSGLFLDRTGANGIQLNGIPYIHKSFQTPQGDLEPYLAVPIGIDFSTDGNYSILTSANVGLMFRTTETLRTTFELSLPVINTNTVINSDTVISAGVIYYH